MAEWIQIYCGICEEEPDWISRTFGSFKAQGKTLVASYCWRHQKRAFALEQEFLAKGQPFQREYGFIPLDFPTSVPDQECKIPAPSKKKDELNDPHES